MNEKVLAFRVGVVVLAAACIAVLLVAIIGGGKSLFIGGYRVYLRFPRAPGVTVETPVRKNGVLIGRIKDVELLDDQVVLTAVIDGNRVIKRNEVAKITTRSLLGDAVVEFVPSGVQGASNTPIGDGDTLSDGLVGADPLQVLANLEGNLQGAIVSIKSAADEVTVFSRNLNNTLGTNDQQLQRILNKTELALESFHGASSTIDEVFGDPKVKANLKQFLADDLPTMFSDVQLTLADARQALGGFERVTEKAEQNLDSLSKITGPLGENGDELALKLRRSVDNIDELTAQLVVFSQAINSSEGTLGSLLHDDELYEDAREMISNLNEQVRGVKPIIENLKVFTDKIATDPRVLGVKGAFDQKPLGVGVKNSYTPIQPNMNGVNWK